jgi:hypothetical protein
MSETETGKIVAIVKAIDGNHPSCIGECEGAKLIEEALAAARLEGMREALELPEISDLVDLATIGSSFRREKVISAFQRLKERLK